MSVNVNIYPQRMFVIIKYTLICKSFDCKRKVYFHGIKVEILQKNACGNQSFKQKFKSGKKKGTLHYDLEKLVFHTSKFYFSDTQTRLWGTKV